MKTTRRIFASLILLAPLLVLFSSAQSTKQPEAKGQYLAYAGTYTTKTSSKGIYAYRYDAATGKLTPLGVAAETADPSFLTIHPNGKYLYAVNESGKTSMVSAFALDKATGHLALLNQLPALGEDPCYISLDRSGKFVLVANYTSGNVVIFPVLADGKLGAATANVRDEGTPGPNKERQEGPHAHWIEVSARNRFVYVSDLGLDRILIYKFDATKGTLAPGEAAAKDAKLVSPFSATLEPGTGPRHALFSSDGNFLYVLGELQSTVTVFANDARETFRQVQRVSMLPAGFSGRNDAAEIATHPSGKFLYASNRGLDSIAIFSIDPGKGTLIAAGGMPTGGKEPRHFAIDPSGKFLFAENQLSDTIVTFRIDPATGKLSPTGDSVSVPSPVDLVFLPEN